MAGSRVSGIYCGTRSMAGSSRPSPFGEEGNGATGDGWTEVRKKRGGGGVGVGEHRPFRWDIVGSVDPARRKELVSYFFTEIPDNFGAKEMMHVFRLYGEALEVVIPPKRDRRGKRFGFVRFLGVTDANEFGVRLDNIIIESKKIFVNIPRFERTRAQEREAKSIIRTDGNTSKNSLAFRDTRSFANLVKGVRKEWKPVQDTDKSVRNFEVNFEVMQRLEGAVLGEVRVVGETYDMEEEMQREGIFSVNAIPMGAKLCLLLEKEKGRLDDVMIVHKTWMDERFRSFSKWDVSKVDEERVAWVRCLGIPSHGWSREFFDFLVKPFGSLIGLADDTKNKKRLDVACLRIVTKCKDFINQRVKISINHKIFEISMAEDVARYGSSSFAKIIGDREEDSSEFDSKDEYVEETMVGLMGGSDQEEVHGRDGTAEQEVGDGGKQRLEVASVETPNCDDANFGRKICHINEELIENIAVSKCDGSIIKKDKEGYRDDMVEPEDREVTRRRSMEASQENSKFGKVNFGNIISHTNEGIFGNDEAGLCEGPTKIVADTLTSQRLNKEVLKQVGLTRENGPINSDPFNLMEIIEGALAKERGVDSRSKYSELPLAKEGPVLIQGATNGSKPNLDQTKSILGKHGASEPEEQHVERAVAAVQRPYRSAPKLVPSSANALVSQSVLFNKNSRLLVGLNPK